MKNRKIVFYTFLRYGRFFTQNPKPIDHNITNKLSKFDEKICFVPIFLATKSKFNSEDSMNMEKIVAERMSKFFFFNCQGRNTTY